MMIICSTNRTFICLLRSFSEGLLLHVVLVLRGRIQVPYVALGWEIRVVQEAIAWLSVAYDAGIVVVAERIHLQLVVRPDVLSAIDS